MATVTAINAESSTAGTPWEWAAVNTASVLSLGPTSTSAHAGASGYQITYAGTGVGGFGLKTFATQTVAHVKFYWKFDAGFLFSAAWNTVPFFRLVYAEWYEGAPLVFLGALSDGTSAPTRWSWGGSGISSGDTNTNFSLNAWHEIEIFWAYVATAASVWWMSVDNATIASSITLSPSYTSCNRLRLGMADLFAASWPATGAQLHLDDIIVYDTYTSDVVADYYSGRGIGRGLGRGIMRFIDDENQFQIPALEGYAWN